MSSFYLLILSPNVLKDKEGLIYFSLGHNRCICGSCEHLQCGLELSTFSEMK